MSSATATAKRPCDTELSMAVATLLILNSHLESFYPRPWLSADGLLGIDMFFLLSGFRIASGASIDRGFPAFAWQRIIRIFPALWIIQFADCFDSGFPKGWLYGLNLFGWPTIFSYLFFILPFYVVLFGLNRLVGKSTGGYGWVVGAVGIAWMAAMWAPAEPPQSFSEISTVVFSCYYFLVFLLGVLAARTGFAATKKCPGWLPALLIPGYFGVKLWVVLARHWSLYPLIHLLGAMAAVTLCWWFADGSVFKSWRSMRVPAAAIAFLAAHSLEIYFAHLMLLRWMNLDRITFPLNLVAMVSLAFAMAWLLAYAADWVRRGLQGLAAKVS